MNKQGKSTTKLLLLFCFGSTLLLTNLNSIAQNNSNGSTYLGVKSGSYGFQNWLVTSKNEALYFRRSGNSAELYKNSIIAPSAQEKIKKNFPTLDQTDHITTQLTSSRNGEKAVYQRFFFTGTDYKKSIILVDLLGSESDEFASDVLAQHRLKNFIVGHNFVLVDAQITSGPYNSRRKLYAIPFDLSSPPQNITGDNHLKSSFDGALSEDSNHFVFTEKDAVGAYSTYKLSLLDLSKTLLNKHIGSEIKQLKLNSSEVALVGVDTTVATQVNLETGASTTLGNNETISGCVDEAGETNFITTKTKGVFIYSCENFKGAKLYTLSAQDQTPREILYIKNPEYKEGDTLGYYSFRNIE
jgi:hypothetical protein